MRISRRLFAALAVFAVAWGALWPLVSEARPGPRIPSLICTQAGFQHAPAPAGVEDNFHCPLCVIAVDAIAPPAPPALAWVVAAEARIAAARPAAPPALHLALPPPSRAPPLS
jgi:hypothetical protein